MVIFQDKGGEMKIANCFVVTFLLLYSVRLIAVVSILITGGSGYIGSHVAYRMKQEGYHIINLDKKNNKALHNVVEYIEGDVADKDLLASIFETYDVEAVVHCAALLQVGESVKDPLKYYINNVSNTLVLLETMLKYDIKTFIFSSSAAVYGVPQWLPLTEDHPRNPINPYGRTKLMIEMICEDFAQAYGLQFVMLRYFNAAGAMPARGLGEEHSPETHLIPCFLHSLIQNRSFYIFGNDYSTPDGTCIRDFIHVCDIADAHWCALNYLQNGGTSDCFNLGTGHGFSIKEVIETAQKVCSKSIDVQFCKRRPGDPPTLVADFIKAHKVLGWKPKYSKLENIIQDAYQYMCQQSVHERAKIRCFSSHC